MATQTITRVYRGSEYEYEFLGVTNDKLCYHLVPRQYPFPVGIKHVLTFPAKKER